MCNVSSLTGRTYQYTIITTRPSRSHALGRISVFYSPLQLESLHDCYTIKLAWPAYIETHRAYPDRVLTGPPDRTTSVRALSSRWPKTRGCPRETLQAVRLCAEAMSATLAAIAVLFSLLVRPSRTITRSACDVSPSAYDNLQSRRRLSPSRPAVR